MSSGGRSDELRVRMGDDAWVDARLRPRVTWPRRALGGLGPGQLFPDSRSTGIRCCSRRRSRARRASAAGACGSRALARMWRRTGAPGSPGAGGGAQADAFPDPDVGVAFAGGRLPMLGVSAAPTAVVVRLGERVLRLVPPLARAQARVNAQSWHVQVRSPRYRLELEGETAGDGAPAARPRRVGATCRDALSAGAGGPAPPARRSGTAHAHRRGLASRRPRVRGAVWRSRFSSA